MNDGGTERNQVRITSHEADVTAVLHHGNDVAGKQRTFSARASGPVQNRAAFEMAAAIDQRQTFPERQNCSFPKLNPWTFAHDPLAIGCMQKDLRVESFGPFDHRRIKMRM